MEIDATLLSKLLALPDDQLWALIRKIGASNHITLPDGPPPKEEMAKLRTLFSGENGMDQERAMRLIQEYRDKRR